MVVSHTRDKINTVSADVYVVSHVEVVYKRSAESAKAIHSIFYLSFRQSDLDENSSFVQKKGVVSFAERKTRNSSFTMSFLNDNRLSAAPYLVHKAVIHDLIHDNDPLSRRKIQFSELWCQSANNLRVS